MLLKYLKTQFFFTTPAWGIEALVVSHPSQGSNEQLQILPKCLRLKEPDPKAAFQGFWPHLCHQAQSSAEADTNCKASAEPECCLLCYCTCVEILLFFISVKVLLLSKLLTLVLENKYVSENNFLKRVVN